MLTQFREHFARESLEFRVLRITRSFVEEIDRVFVRVDHLVEIRLVEIAAALFAELGHGTLIEVVARRRRQTFAAGEGAQLGARLRVFGDELLREGTHFGIGRLLSREFRQANFFGIQLSRFRHETTIRAGEVRAIVAV